MTDENKNNDGQVQARKVRMTPGLWAGAAGVIVLVSVLAFAGGIFITRATSNNGSNTQRMGDTSHLPSDMQGAMPSGQRMGMFGGGITGEVIEISSSKITLKEERTGGLVTYEITSNTEVTDDGDDAAIDDIQAGDTVQIQGTDDTEDTAAGTIILNPTTPTRVQFQ